YLTECSLCMAEKRSLSRNVARRLSGSSANGSTVAARSPPTGLLGEFGRGQLNRRPKARDRVAGAKWSATELDLQVASPGPGRHRLSGRIILSETVHRRGNREVTSNNYTLFPARNGIEQTCA